MLQIQHLHDLNQLGSALRVFEAQLTEAVFHQVWNYEAHSGVHDSYTVSSRANTQQVKASFIDRNRLFGGVEGSVSQRQDRRV